MRAGTLELQLKIAGQAVEEFVHEDQTYVECNLMHETATYKVPLAEGNSTQDVAMWPVTPYTLTLRNTDQNNDIWANLYVDGCKIKRSFVARGASVNVLGIDDGTSTKELLFSFPRLMTSEHDKMDKERLSQVGEIKVVTNRATFLKKETRRGGGSSFDRTNFQQANKKDAKFAPSNSTTRMGKTISSQTAGTGQKVGTFNVYSVGEELNVTVLKYRMRHVLQSWGFLPDQSTASQSAAAAKKRPAATPVATEKSGSVPAPVKRSKNG